jgi:hypothetical protein
MFNQSVDVLIGEHADASDFFQKDNNVMYNPILEKVFLYYAENESASLFLKATFERSWISAEIGLTHVTLQDSSGFVYLCENLAPNVTCVVLDRYKFRSNRVALVG